MMRRILTLSGLLLATTPLATADVVYEFDTRPEAGAAATRQTIEVGSGNLRMNFNEDNHNGSMIYRSESRSFIMLDHDSRSYFELSEETMQEIGATMNEAMKQMEEALKNISQSQRAMVEKMMKDRMGDATPTAVPQEPLEFSEGGSGSVAGYSCREVSVSQGGRKVRDVCVTEWGSIEGGSEAAAVMQSMSEFLEELVDTLSNSGPFGQMFEMNRGAFEALDELGGIPVSAVEYDEQGRAGRESTLVSANAQTVAADRFETPEGYKKQEIRPGN